MCHLLLLTSQEPQQKLVLSSLESAYSWGRLANELNERHRQVGRLRVVDPYGSMWHDPRAEPLQGRHD